MRLTRRSLVAASIATPLIARPLHAQGAWPQRQIRWVVPFPPAGTADILSRLLADRLATRLGQPVVVDNRAGALVAQARGDTHTVMVSNFAPHGVSPSLFANIGYDAERDFTHMALFGALPMVIAVNPNLPAQNIQEFIALARQRGAALNMAYGGNGTASHLIGLIFHRAAGISPTFVPYRGAGPALVDVLAGTVECIIETLPAAVGHIRAGRLRA
ncbi:MAG: Bug family tripartite tricarboxylate transporter substrate binding protein, partial [Alphaproteobacteria bacterium]